MEQEKDLTENFSKLEKLHGKIKELLLPTGNKVIIREQNGEDDEILSKRKDAFDGTSFNNFIKGIVVYSEEHKGPLTYDDVFMMPLRDKYFILLASRQFSLGDEIEFSWNWGTEQQPNKKHYLELVSRYLWDYNLPFPEKDHEDYDPQRIAPYPKGGKEVHLTLKSGKEIKFEYLSGWGEKFLTTRSEEEISVNDELKARRVSVKLDTGKYHILENFKNLSAKDMKEIRESVRALDPRLDLFTDIENPDTKEIEYLPIIMITDFFYPASI